MNDTKVRRLLVTVNNQVLFNISVSGDEEMMNSFIRQFDYDLVPIAITCRDVIIKGIEDHKGKVEIQGPSPTPGVFPNLDSFKVVTTDIETEGEEDEKIDYFKATGKHPVRYVTKEYPYPGGIGYARFGNLSKKRGRPKKTDAQ